MKIRHGGLAALEQQVLDGDTRALRALVRQACGPNTLDRTFRDVELKAAANGTGGERLTFTGYASTTEDPYEMQDWLGPYTEVVRAGAFTRTLNAKPDVIFCLNHGWDGAPMARTIAGTLILPGEDSTGLPVEAHLDASRADVHQVRSAMDAGELGAMSFAFWTTRQMWSPDYEQRDIQEVDLDGGDVSVVTWPANPGTWGTTDLRKRQALSLMRTKVPGLLIERARSEKRAGKALSATTMETLQAVLDLLVDADVAVDAAQPLLAELMGVPNPDTDGEAPSTDSAQETDSAPAGMSLTRLRLLEDPALRSA